MSVAERNRRVAGRHGVVSGQERPRDIVGTLTVPPHAAITPALFAALPPLASSNAYRIVWHDRQPPLTWRGTAPGGAEDVVRLADGAVLDVSTPTARRTAAWQLLRASGKPQDGWLSRHVHRRISRPFSYVFLELGWSANAATLITFLVGLVGAIMLAQTTHATMIAGGFLFWFASIADGIDGEVARVTLTESRFGEQLDTGVDQATYAAGLMGVFVGWWRQGIGIAGLALALAVAVGTPAMLAWAMALVRRARGTSQFFVPAKPIEIALFRAADATSALPLRASAAIFVLFRREAFSFSFFLLSLATARRAAIPLAIGLGLLVVGTTFLAYMPILTRTLQEIVGPRPVDTATPSPAPRSSVPA